MQVEAWIAGFCHLIGITNPVAIAFATGSAASLLLMIALMIAVSGVIAVGKWILGL